MKKHFRTILAIILLIIFVYYSSRGNLVKLNKEINTTIEKVADEKNNNLPSNKIKEEQANKNVKSEKRKNTIHPDKYYYSKEDVALYLHIYGKLPKNYLTKSQAKKKGWDSRDGNLWDVTDKGVIGGDVFSNREGKLPKGEKYFEADVNYKGGFRGDDRLIYTSGGKVIYFTTDHYNNFEVLYE